MAVQHPRAPRWPLFVMGALVAALVAGAIVIAGLPLLNPQSSPPPAASASAASASAAAVGETDAPPPALAEIDPGNVHWVSADRPIDPLEKTYWLQAGTLDERLMDIQVPFAAGGDALPNLGPAFTEPRGGTFVYVADGGASSEFHVADLNAQTTEVVAAVDDIVWTVVWAADRAAAYALLVDGADTMREVGVVRVALDGSGDVEMVMEPHPRQDAAVRLVAVAGLIADLFISDDGRHLLRRTCVGVNPCVVDVLDVESGDIVTMPDRPVLAVDDGLVFSMQCGEVSCDGLATDIATGEELPLSSTQTGVAVPGPNGPIYVASNIDRVGVATIVASDLRTGVRRELIARPNGNLQLHANALYDDIRFEVPDGWVLASTLGPKGQQDWVGLRVFDGEAVGLPPPPREPLFPPGMDG